MPWKYNPFTKTLDFYQSANAGVWTQPTIVNNNNGTYTVGSDGIYHLYPTGDGSGCVQAYRATGATFTPTNNDVNYLVANYNNGSPVIQNITDLSLIDFLSVIPIQTIYRIDNDLDFLNWDEEARALANKIEKRLIKTERFSRQSGLILSEAATRKVNITSGIVYYGGIQLLLDEFETGEAGNMLREWVYDGATWTPTVVTQYNNSEYQGPTGKITATGNKYLNVWVFRKMCDTKVAGYVLGTNEYSTLAQAEDAMMPALPEMFQSFGLMVGRIIIRNGDPAASVIQSAFVEIMGAAIVDHNSLMDIQGGQANEYYHLTSAQHTNLTSVSPSFQTVKLTNLTDGYMPYHAGDATGLADTSLYWNGTYLQYKLVGLTQPVTDFSPTDCCGRLIRQDSGGGGVTLSGFTDVGIIPPLSLQGIIGISNPTDATLAVRIVAYKSDGGTGVANLDDKCTVLGICNGSTQIASIIGDGTLKINHIAEYTSSHGVIIDNNLFVGGSISGITGKFSGLTDGYVPYHVSDATGLANSVLYQSGTALFINDTANIKNTCGLTITQSATIDEIVSLKASDLTHPFTAITEADTYGILERNIATYGTFLIRGLSGGDKDGLVLAGFVGSAAPTASTVSGVKLVGYKTDGATSIAALGSDEAVASVWNYTTKIATFFGDGDFIITGALGGTTGRFTSLTDGYVPYHVSDTSGLANSVICTDGTTVGINTSVSSTMLNIRQSATATGQYGETIVVSTNFSADGSYTNIGLYVYGINHIQTSGTTNSSYLNGIRVEYNINNASFQGGLNQMFGLYVNTGVQSCGAGTDIGTIYGQYLYVYNNDADAAIDYIYGLFINSPGVASSVAIGRYGVVIGGITSATDTLICGVSVGALTTCNTSGAKYGVTIGAISGTGTNSYGLNIGNVSGATNSYSIYTGTGLVRFGDSVQITSGGLYTDHIEEYTSEHGVVLDSVTCKDSKVYAVTGIFSDLTDNYVPYHVSDSAGLANSCISADSDHVGIGAGISSYNKLYVVHAIADDTTSQNGATFSCTMNITVSAAYTNTALSVGFTDYEVASGISNTTGYTCGILVNGYISNANHQGTLYSQYGIYARAGIYSCGAGGTITTVYGIQSYVFNNDADGTITTGYSGLFYNSETTGTMTNRYGVAITCLPGAGTIACGLLFGIPSNAWTLTGTQTTKYGILMNPIKGASTTNYGINIGDVTEATTNYAIYTGAGTVRFGGTVYINDTANSLCTTGITINQGTADNEIFCCKSSDVSHGMTTNAEADTYFRVKKLDADAGGVLISGLSDAAGASGISIQGAIGSTDPTDTVPAVILQGYKQSGTGFGTLGAAETVLTIQNGTTVLATVLGDGKTGFGMVPTYSLDVTGNIRCSTGFGCNGATPQTAYASGGAAPAGGTGATAGAYDTAAHRDALITLVNNIRAALVANGIMS